MYEVLHRSRITLNRHAHINVRGRVATNVANNMRLYEATGVGTCLLTEARDNLCEMFEPDREVMTYSDDADCVERIAHLLEHEAERLEIARAGQRRTLSDHTYAARMEELLALLQHHLEHRGR
jgi:spore maturation protein CgeB